ncbi:hypothetical protein [Streptomyces melanogenes]|uniref:hypothetical protein n=1 Tax=Streptomyces melanogenes TaxID=67326 RepID=UPI00167E57A8|nr:hypothetical protein [Streptomyces melanogenes]GGP77394.1 hypothetical protein GCM10010278_64800 [Streptomyces melanogenes]
MSEVLGDGDQGAGRLGERETASSSQRFECGCPGRPVVHLTIAIPAQDSPTEAASHDPAQYRRCEVCHETGADVITHMFVADSGRDHTSYAHRECAEATGAGEVITP